MSVDAWIAIVLAVFGLIAVYTLPRMGKKPPPKVTMPRLTLVRHKRRSWK